MSQENTPTNADHRIMERILQQVQKTNLDLVPRPPGPARPIRGVEFYTFINGLNRRICAVHLAWRRAAEEGDFEAQELARVSGMLFWSRMLEQHPTLTTSEIIQIYPDWSLCGRDPTPSERSLGVALATLDAMQSKLTAAAKGYAVLVDHLVLIRDGV